MISWQAQGLAREVQLSRHFLEEIGVLQASALCVQVAAQVPEQVLEQLLVWFRSRFRSRFGSRFRSRTEHRFRTIGSGNGSEACFNHHFQHKSYANSMALFQCAVRGDYYNVAITLYFLELICVRWMPVQGYLFASLDM